MRAAIPIRLAVRNTLAPQVCSRRSTRVFSLKIAQKHLAFQVGLNYNKNVLAYRNRECYNRHAVYGQHAALRAKKRYGKGIFTVSPIEKSARKSIESYRTRLTGIRDRAEREA